MMTNENKEGVFPRDNLSLQKFLIFKPYFEPRTLK